MTQKRRQHQKRLDDNAIGLDGELKIPLNTPKTSPNQQTDRKLADKFRPDFTDLHFTSSLYIDRAVEALQASVMKANNERRDLLIIKSDVTRVDVDRARFELESQRMGQTTYTMKGTMQRWQGTRTRVDVKIHKRHVNIFGKSADTSIYNGEARVVLVIVFVLAFLFMLAFRNDSFFFLLGGFITVFAGIMFFLSVFEVGKEREYIPRNKVHIDVNELNAVVADTFKEHDIQWLQR